MTDRIHVSIVTPCYNGARFLRSTLESAVAQTAPPLEIIVIDDGSTDDSAAIAESFGFPVRVLRQPNRGESVARNRGIAEARGTHVLFLDADDLLAPEALERMTGAVAGRPDAVALMGCAWFSDDPARPQFERPPMAHEFFPGIIASNFAPPHSWLAPLGIVRRAGGFHEPLRWFEDWDLWWRVGLQQPQLVPVNYIGALYRQHAASQLATTRPADRARGHAILMRRMTEAILTRPEFVREHGYTLFWSGWTALARARHFGVSWPELRDLVRALRHLARIGPPSLTRSRIARTLRYVGAPVALAFTSVDTSLEPIRNAPMAQTS